MDKLMNKQCVLAEGFHYKKIGGFFSKYKYETKRHMYLNTNILGHTFSGKYFAIYSGGVIVVKPEYQWNGSSGPSIDTGTNMRASLWHDLIWQLLEMGIIKGSYRPYSNTLYRDICLLDGMHKIRAHYSYEALDTFGRFWI